MVASLSSLSPAFLFTIAAIGCSMAYSSAGLLVWHVVQGTGAGTSMTIAFAIVRDLFEGQTARTKVSHITMATMVVPMLAPTVGVGLLGFGGWRIIHAALAGVGTLLLLAVLFGFSESATLDPANRLAPSAIARNYGPRSDALLLYRLYPGQGHRVQVSVRLCERVVAVSDQHSETSAGTIRLGVRGDLYRDHGGVIS
jgi:MFS family permease